MADTFLAQASSEVGSRLGVGGLFTPATGVAVRSGVLHGLSVAQTATATGEVTVAAGRAVVQASSATGGAYLGTQESTVNVGVLSGVGSTPAESSPRNDMIVWEAGVGARVVKGTASATPVDPAVPAQSVALARVRVKAASAYVTEVIVNADLDDLRVPTGLSGGVLPVATEAILDTITGQPGMRAVVLADGREWEWTTGWEWPRAAQGVLARATGGGTGPTTTGAETPLNGLLATVTVPAGRRLRIEAKFRLDGSAGNRYFIQVLRAGTKIDYEAVQKGGNLGVTLHVLSDDTPPAGSHQYSLTIQQASGSGEWNVTGTGAGFRSFLLVEDVGRA